MLCSAENSKRQEESHEESKKIENYYYNQSDKVGEGNFSQVYRGRDRDRGMNVAIKVIKYSSLTTKIAEELLKNEVSILKIVNHQNIIRCHDVLSSKNNCYIVTDFY
jgi:serine/threonine protein kinase